MWGLRKKTARGTPSDGQHGENDEESEMKQINVVATVQEASSKRGNFTHGYFVATTPLFLCLDPADPGPARSKAQHPVF